MIRPDLNALQRLVADGQRHEVDVAQAAHAQLGEQPAGAEPAGDVHSGIHDSRPAWQRVDINPQLARPRRGGVNERPCAFVHSESRHRRTLYRSNRSDRSDRSDRSKSAEQIEPERLERLERSAFERLERFERFERLER
jgi:hypothetical protein